MDIEEWWGHTFEKRGSIAYDQMPDSSQRTIQRLRTEDLCEMVRSEDTRSVRGLLAHIELRRRENWTARAAIAIAIVALVVSAIN